AGADRGGGRRAAQGGAMRLGASSSRPVRRPAILCPRQFYNLRMETQKPTQSTSPWVWVAAALAVLVVIACLCIAVVGVGVGIFGIASVFNTPSVVQVTAVAVAQPVPTLPHSYDPTPLSTPEPAASLPPLTPDIEAFSAELPPRDRYELARRFLGIEEAPTPEPVTYQIGDVTTFWVSNDDL